MGQVRTKKEIVKMLLKNKELENEDESQLMEILFNEPIAIDVDKQALESETWKDKLADKITEKAGSWGFIIGFIIIPSISKFRNDMIIAITNEIIIAFG